eukprot:GEMP01128183.1.p3 GENE.GEMP01128183.1~~GEMP01128183.1.p3  ORF type:complete len:130 (+),score=34.81 GEMP01128183.1:54-443(+)
MDAPTAEDCPIAPRGARDKRRGATFTRFDIGGCARVWHQGYFTRTNHELVCLDDGTSVCWTDTCKYTGAPKLRTGMCVSCICDLGSVDGGGVPCLDIVQRRALDFSPNRRLHCASLRGGLTCAKHSNHS